VKRKTPLFAPRQCAALLATDLVHVPGRERRLRVKHYCKNHTADPSGLCHKHKPAGPTLPESA
jgi:hypothetical protein